jgi:hypothetical protein
VSDLLNAAPAAGWYPDPITEAQLRWWDGEGWTERTSELGSAPETLVAPEPEPVVAVAPPVTAVPDDAPPRSRRDVHPRLESNPVVATRAPVAPAEGVINYSAPMRIQPVVPLLPARSSTPAAWGLAFLPWIVQVLALVVGFATAFSSSPLILGAGVAVIMLLTVALVVRDRRQLDALGHIGPASAWWILLAPPLAYLIARTISTHRNNGKGAAPLVVYLVNSVVITVVSVVATVMFPEVFGVPVPR